VRKARDEAWELIGRWLYGSLWIGELNTPEYNISKRYEQAEKRLTTPNRLPVDPKKAMRNARANFRSQAAAFQYGQVLRWLEDEQRIDMRPAKFDQAKFKEWFRKRIGRPPRQTATEARKAAVERVLRRDGSPGRGGIPWKTFVAGVRKEFDGRYDLRTVKRDVQELERPRKIGHLGHLP
jgi:hypothetical protein